MKAKSCCFTGHRKLPDGQRVAIMERTETAVKKLLSGGINRFLLGGAVGYDAEVAKLLFRHDKVIKASERSGREAYLLRNRILVDSSAVCIAYCHKQRSGTAYTVRYAKAQGMAVTNTAPGMEEDTLLP